jgi:hypothetical protein
LWISLLSETHAKHLKRTRPAGGMVANLLTFNFITVLTATNAGDFKNALLGGWGHCKPFNVEHFFLDNDARMAKWSKATLALISVMFCPTNKHQ